MHKKYSKNQITFLVILRVFIGWHFLYEGIVKALRGSWSAIGYLMDSQGIFKVFFNAIAQNPYILKIVDFFNVYSLIIIGLFLILGLFTKITTLSGVALLSLYYLSHPPFIGAEYALPMEGNYLWIDKNLIEIAALLVLVVFPTGKIIGLDRFICKTK